VAWFFQFFQGFTDIVMPYAFICMMTFGMLRGNAGGAKTKSEINIISLLTFSEQKSLLGQMQQYVDDKVEEVKHEGRTGRSYSNQY
jgi:hypothetical protein